MSRAFSLTTRAVEDLVPYAGNSRTHSEAQIVQLAASIKEFGFTSPVLIDEQNTIIAGEGRVLAATKLKLEAVPCVVLTGLSEAQKAAYVIADNKLALNAGWDTDKLLAELGRIADLDLDVNLSGFSEVEVMALLDHVQSELENVPAGTDARTSGDSSQATQPDWSGMPEFEQAANKPFRTLLVHFDDQESVDLFAKRLQRNITDKTKYLWWPEQIRLTKTGVVYE